MRVLPLLVLLCVAVLSAEATKHKCKYFGQICSKSTNCIPGYSKPAYVCRSRKLLGGAAKLCRFGGSWCPDGKVCRQTKAGRRCVFRKGTKVRSCKRLGQSCAKGRKCIPCYLRSGLCCRRASLLGKRKYCGVRYKYYGKLCGKFYKYKKGCYRYGTYCADGKSCRRLKSGKRVCVFKKKLPRCGYFGQICGLKNNRSCIPCFYRKGYCCRRRKLLATGAKHCRYGGKFCPDKKVCRQSVKKGVVTRRCVYVPRCKYPGQTCGQYKRRVCLRCSKKKLCCSRGVTKGKCQKGCKGPRKYCSLKGCRKGFKGWCCKTKRISKAQCLKTCKGRWKYCSLKGCPKGFLGWCCRERPNVTKSQCQKICKGPWKYCSVKGCPKNFRGWCCRKRPFVTKAQCQKTCKGPWTYCSLKGCAKNFRGWCCRRRLICKGKGKKYCKG